MPILLVVGMHLQIPLVFQILGVEIVPLSVDRPATCWACTTYVQKERAMRL